MTENSNETLCGTQFLTQIKRHLTNSIYNDTAHCFNNGNEISNQLTDSNLKYNVQIVLDNLKRNAVEKTYLLNDKTNTNTNSDNGNGNFIYRNLIGGTMSSPESDCNSNPHGGPIQQLACSIASSHDFTHDNSDYQWFLDYGYVRKL